jgi:hypothetical protein
MQRLHQFFLRQIRTGICLFCAGLATVTGWGQADGPPRLQPQFLSKEIPDQDAGHEILAHLRQLGLAGDYYLQFHLEVLPRRGPRHTVPGAMWGTRLSRGPAFRAEIGGGASGSAQERLFAINGPQAEAWRVTYNSNVPVTPHRVTDAELLESIAGTGISLFELQMPFLYWPEHVYEGTTTLRGRSVHAFLMYPPAEFATAHPDMAGVRLHLDAKFHALMQAVFLNGDGEVHRKMTVLDLKKLGEQWTIKTIEVRDEESRNKVRFEVKGAALGLDLSEALFSPEMLEQSVAPPDNVKPLRW